jgi:UDP-glucose 4-epimerase
MILLTGASGFIGKQLLQSLIAEYGRKNILALTSVPQEVCDYLLHNNYTFSGNYFSASGYNNISTVIHAGAFIPKRSSEINNYQLCFSNIESTFRLLQALPQSVTKIIFLSTIDVYDSSGLINEKTEVNPASLYGQSKYYCEKMVEAWAIENKKRSVILRLGHVYGPGEEHFEKLIPSTIRRILNHTAPQIWGDGNQKRTFIYVQDAISAIMHSINAEINNDTINIVGGQAVAIREIVEKLIRIAGLELRPEFIESTSRPRDTRYDNNKMQNLLSKESFDMDKGLRIEYEYMSRLTHTA